MIGNLMKLKLPKSSSSPNKEMEFGREEVTPNRLKQLNKMKARRPIKDMMSPMVSVDITDPSMADAEVMDMGDFGADEVGKGEKASEHTELRNSTRSRLRDIAPLPLSAALMISRNLELIS